MDNIGMEIIYNNKNIYGQFLTTEETKDAPFVSLKGLNKRYTLIMYDPNAVRGNCIHWIVTDIYGNNFKSGRDLLLYKGPAPPKCSGIHNYIFALYETNNIITIEFDDNNRTIELNELLNKLSIRSEPIYTKKFISENNEESSCIILKLIYFLIFVILFFVLIVIFVPMRRKGYRIN